mmetsp:Transcript_96450/g.171491  ORF Transcript_96450/g.171491 Transcript_96450/m.171491 type:complete len:958 (+) Transcript_96450:73-2946(+)
MPTYDVAGVPVEFPYEAYECQLAYMRAVVRALDAGDNALLESPTGTGKTLCLLCAALGWRRHREKLVKEAKISWEVQADPNAPRTSVPSIFYSSRTHTQLKQVMKELKRTTYKPQSVVLGSRQHFCIHASVSRHSGARQNAMCRKAVDEHKCPFHVGFRKCGSKVSTSLKDMEEIVECCKEEGVCPYFKVREDAKNAELLLLPYDYLISKQTREAMNVSMRNSILIFDEGHNIERSCEENSSIELTQIDIGGSVSEIEDAVSIIEKGDLNEEVLGDWTSDMALNHLNLVKKKILALDSSIKNQKLSKDPASGRRVCKAQGNHVLEIIRTGNYDGVGISVVDPQEVQHINQVVKRTMGILTYGQDTSSSGGLCLDKIDKFFSAAFKLDGEDLKQNYQVLIYEDFENEVAKRGSKRKMDFFTPNEVPSKDGSLPRTLCLWCFSCSMTMKEILKEEVHSVIITSGTLSPLESTAEAFGVPFPVTLENSHVINASKQLWGGVLTAGPEKVSLDASFANRSEQAYIQDLGNAVKDLASHVPDGLLLAFSSYSQKDSVLNAWRQSGQLAEMCNVKPLFEEPKSNFETKDVMNKYNAALANGPIPGRSVGGAILAAVCRGKLCEGIDFTDRQCRMVVMVGIPYPSKNDLRVMLKQDFLDLRGSEGDGRRWYTREAVRAVNQTLGRVIRHRDDFGGVVLCDARYASGSRLSGIGAGLSSWLRPQVSIFSSFAGALQGCQRFFGSTAQLQMPAVSPPTQAPSQPVTSQTAPPTAASGNRRAKSMNVLGALMRGRKLAAEPKEAIAEASRAPATPQAPEAKQPDRLPTAPQRITAFRRTSAGPAPPLISAARRDTETMEKRWLNAAEVLLPRMELDIVLAHLSRARKEAELIMDPSPGGSDEILTKAMRQIAECLLPELCFDTADEERSRESLVRDGGTLFPKLFSPLWKSVVQDVLKANGSARKIW